MKKKRLFSLLLCLFLLCGTLQFSAFAQEPEEEVTTHVNMPTTMKIGDSFGGFTYDSNIYFEGLPKNSWVVPISSIESYAPFAECRWFSNHSFEAGYLQFSGEEGKSVAESLGFCLAFTKPGKLVIFPYCGVYTGTETDPDKIRKSYSETSEDWDIYVPGPIEFTVEEPKIETNLPQTIPAGETIDFMASLTGTALENEETAYYLNPDNYADYGGPWQMVKDYECHKPAYLPKLEVLEGEELIERENADDSKTLTYQETLKFKKPGTVKLKLTYQMFNTCNQCLKGENFFFMDENGVSEDITYSPEKIFTIQVTEKEVSSSSQPSESSSQPSSQTSSQGTTSASSSPEQAGNSSSQLPSSSQTSFQNSIETEHANSSNASVQNGNADSTSSADIPATGGNSFILPVIFLLILSVLSATVLIYKQSRKNAA